MQVKGVSFEKITKYTPLNYTFFNKKWMDAIKTNRTCKWIW